MTSCDPASIDLKYTDGTPDGYSTSVTVDFYPQDTGNQNIKIIATDKEGNKQDSSKNYQVISLLIPWFAPHEITLQSR